MINRLILRLQWNPVKTVTYQPKKFGRINRLAILTRVFLQENVWRFFLGGQKNVAITTR